MTNYNNGKIYKIESHLGDMIYIGSTTKKYLSERMTSHRSDYNRYKEEKKGMITSFKLFDEYGIENCSIILLELVKCNSKDELQSREAYYIKLLPCVNKYIPLRNRKQYCDDNKEKHHQYYTDNKEKHKEYYKTYRQTNKEIIMVKVECACGGSYNSKNKYIHNKTIKHLKYLENL